MEPSLNPDFSAAPDTEPASCAVLLAVVEFCVELALLAVSIVLAMLLETPTAVVVQLI